MRVAVRGQCHTDAVGRVWGAAAEPPGPKAELWGQVRSRARQHSPWQDAPA